MSAEIHLSGLHGRGLVALIDDDLAPAYRRFSWFIDSDGYARRSRHAEDGLSGPRIISMHRQVLGLHTVKGIPGDDVDHIDGNRLNNTRSNLRRATRSQNNINRHARGKFIGVNFFHKTALRKRWRAYVTQAGKQYCVGYFETAEEAALARDAKAQELFGDRAALNFPEMRACR